MKTRLGFVSNSSSSSFIIAMRKGCLLSDLVKEAGPFSGLAQEVVAFITGQVPAFQSVQNIALYMADKDYEGYYAPEKILEIAKAEYGWLEEECMSLVDNPDEWFFGYGRASYNEGTPTEQLIGNGALNIRTENFVLKNIGS